MGSLRSARTGTIVVGLLLVTISVSLAQLMSAPMNPEYRQALGDSVGGPALDAEGHALGFIPPPFKLPIAAGLAQDWEPVGAPATYDLRNTSGKVPPVRNQGSCGSCWAFATYGSLETYLRPGDTTDLSENHLRSNHGWDYGSCSGGHHYMSAAYLSRWAGPVLESEDPYTPTEPTDPASPTLAPNKHVQEVLFLAGDAATIKNAIMNYGAAYVSYYSTSTYYYSGPGGTAYYCPSATTTSHAVSIIGWDDGFAKTNFKPGTQPTSDGAWLVRNSWGSGWGDSGYFWCSYQDAKMASSYAAVFNSAEPIANYDNNYQYDPLGNVSSLNCPYAANVFTASGDETLRAVSFYTEEPGASYTVRVYKNPSPVPAGGSVASTVSGSFTHAGYHTVPLSTPVGLSSGDTFSVSVYITGGGTYPSAVEYAYAGVTSGATASAGQSYYSFSGTSWGDLTTAWNSTANFCIKAFTTDNNPAPTVTEIDPISAPNTASIGVTITGTGFLDGATAALQKAGETDIGGTSLTVVNDQQITCDFDITGATVGLWDVTVTNTDAQSGTLPDGFEVLAGDVSCPDITQWSVAATHTGSGELLSPIADGYVEPRVGVVSCLVLNFDEPLDGATFTPSCVSIIGVTNGDQSSLVASVALEGDGSVARVTLSGVLPQPDRYTVTISDAVKDPAGNALGGDRDIKFGVLHGDTNGNGVVDIGDMLAVRGRFGTTVGVGACRYDVNCNGTIDIGDMLAVRAHFGSSLPAEP